MLNPVLNPGEFGAVFQSLQAIHVVKVIPKIMRLVDMFVEVVTFSLQGTLVSRTYVASIVTLILDLFLGVTLLGELVDDDGRDNVS